MADETRVCKQCGMEKPLREFYSYRQGNKICRKWMCLQCEQGISSFGTKTCSSCKLEKSTSDFTICKDTQKYNTQCKECVVLKKAIYYQNNKEDIQNKVNDYRSNNLEIVRERDRIRYKNDPESKKISAKKYRETHAEEIQEQKHQYYENNKEEIKSDVNIYRKSNRDKINDRRLQRMNDDPFFRAHENFRSLFRVSIKKYGLQKEGKSISDLLPYTYEDFIIHIEALFDPWMTWNNWGKYDAKNWNDNDPTTWTWQLDHIIPQSDLPYSSFDDNNFYKCWSLENLRPLSAKQNSLDGANRIRHKKKRTQ